MAFRRTAMRGGCGSCGAPLPAVLSGGGFGDDNDESPSPPQQPSQPSQPSQQQPSPPGGGFRQFASAAPAQAAQAAQAVSAGASSALGLAKDHWVVLVVALGVLLLAWLLWYLVRLSYRASSGSRDATMLVPVPASTDKYRRFPGKGLPDAAPNGQRLSLSFWVYVSDFSKNDGNFRHVLHVGQEDGSLASPLVFLDKNRNRLVVWFAKTRAEKNPADVGSLLRASPAGVALNGDGTGTTFDVNNHGILIPYVPQQRWVHVAVVVDETVSATTITGYLDGEAVAQTTTGDVLDGPDGTSVSAGRNQYAQSPGMASRKDLRGLNLTLSSGDLYTGGDVYGKGGVGFPGFVSRVSFFNYELNVSDVLALYRKGPYPASWFGLGAYGLRTPVYRLTADESDEV